MAEGRDRRPRPMRAGRPLLNDDDGSDDNEQQFGFRGNQGNRDGYFNRGGYFNPAGGRGDDGRDRDRRHDRDDRGHDRDGRGQGRDGRGNRDRHHDRDRDDRGQGRDGRGQDDQNRIGGQNRNQREQRYGHDEGRNQQDRGQERGQDRDRMGPGDRRGGGGRGGGFGGGANRGGGGANRGGGRRGDRDGGRRNGPLRLTVHFMTNDLVNRDPSDVVLTLSSPQTAFREALVECVTKPDMLKPMLSILAKAFSCNSTPEQFLRMYKIMEESRFFDNVVSYFLDMIGEESVYKQLRFKQSIHDIISIMEGLADKNPASVTQFVGIHEVLKMVIDSLRETSTVIDEDLLKAFRAFTERKEKLLNRRIRRRDREREPDNRNADDQQPYEEPPEDFRTIQIFPQTADMQIADDRYLKANKVRGGYQDVDHYLDVQFRLLREDFVAPLRDGINNYIQSMEENPRKRQKLQDVRIYNNVRLIAPDSGDNGLCHVLQFDVSRMGNVRWFSTKRLIYGSLLCLSSDHFRTFYFATVMNREPKHLAKGLVSVHFEHTHAEVRQLYSQIFTMAETTAYFESYRHVLNGLKNTREGDLPFERYIIQCNSRVNAPGYLVRRPDAEYDLRPLVDEDMIIQDDRRLGDNVGVVQRVNANYRFSDHSEPANGVSVLDPSKWPTPDLLHLDQSQFQAIRTALTNEFVITQGPPGTGKTYIGLKIVKALLHNKSIWSKHPDTGDEDLRPMLIVCYTNHALDQFLEGIIQFYKGDILRVGGRSNSEILKPYGLHNFRQRFRHAQKIPVAVFRGRREAKNDMDSLMAEINKVSAKLQVATTCILHEDFLRPYMGDFYFLLKQQFDMMLQVYPEAKQFIGSNHSVLVEWLGFGNLEPIVEMESNLAPVVEQQRMPNDDPDDNLIDVDDEIDAVQANRRLDDEEDDDDEGDEFDELFGLLQEGLTRKERIAFKVQIAINEQRKSVALDAEKFGEKPKNVQEMEWQQQKGQRTKMKKKLMKNLASGDIMPEQEVARIADLWRLQIADKWRLYRSWIQKYCDSLREEIYEKEEEFDAAARRYREALMQEDKEIMKQSTILGMTTTGAARYQAVLQEIRPRIIVVEEAAEVLEAHIVTTLSRGCEHLILIGDHKQLKPNPTVYTLARDYNLDVSLFERMIGNGIRCDCLELQHRMRPEISELMVHIYDKLKDHDDVKKYDNIKGISSNIYFIDHNNEETNDEDLRSHSNVHEASYLVALCRYLLLQGYKPEQITVLTLYSGQLFCLRGMMPKEEFNGIRVTVVDNYQGEENDIVLLSLVRSNNEGNIGFLKTENRICVALSRAKKGFYVIGNFNMLKEKSDLWNEIVIDMKNKRRLGKGLVLNCQNHPDDDGLVAKEPTDFMNAPEGGCNKKCNYRLNCGHVCEMFCHVVDREHETYVCRKPCGKVICQNDHRCTGTCGAKCGPCLLMVPKRIPRCGHTQQVPCSTNPNDFECKQKCDHILKCGHACQSTCGMAHTQNCSMTVEKTWPCGHKGAVKCYQKDDALCPEICGAALGCGDLCTGTCGKCFQGRLHKPCTNDCTRILVCGHKCTDRCNHCPPCTKKCENRCVHSKCNRRCGELCVPCMEPCTWRCEHYRCNKLCSEPCDRPRCDQPCRKELTCGHQCIGLCGEPCPTDCKVCDKEKVTELLFGDEDEPYARFVLMEDCRNSCIIESGAMDRYMDEIVDEEIKLKDCPKCKTVIRKNNRYKQRINKTLQDIEQVKKKVLINMDRIRKLEADIKDALQEVPSAALRLKLKRRLNAMNEPKSESALVALSNQITFIKQITKINEDWEKVRLPFFEEDKKQQLRFIEHFKEWILTERTNMSPQETTDGELEIARSQAFLLLLLHQQRAKEIGYNLDKSMKVKIAESEKLLKSSHKYKEEMRLKVEGCLAELKKAVPLTNLGVSEEERKAILKATALPAGHWFKCRNGHIYAIGDCGGAMQVSKCPECGCQIGGNNHQLVAGNELAREMDGAQHAAWSDAANMANYGFDAQF